MAELSFGHNLRAKRKEVVNNTVSFLPWAAGCFTGCAPGQGFNSLESSAPANTIHFNNAPAKMLAVALHEYGSPHQLKVQLCNLPRELREGELLIQVQVSKSGSLFVCSCVFCNFPVPLTEYPMAGCRSKPDRLQTSHRGAAAVVSPLSPVHPGL
jgi:hypothetical protein